MAGDWIKMTHSLPETPEVIGIASSLKIDVFSVVGRLHRIWSWFDRHTTDGCCAASVTLALLDRIICMDGFAEAMVSVGWLVDRNGVLSLPNFDRHNSKSAKARALASERVLRSRRNMSVTEPLPEKRREDIDLLASANKSKASTKRKSFSVEAVAFPPELDTPEARAAATDWLEHKRQRGEAYKSPASFAKKLAEWRTAGAAAFIAAVNSSIGNNYQGIFPPKLNGTDGVRPRGFINPASFPKD